MKGQRKELWEVRSRYWSFSQWIWGPGLPKRLWYEPASVENGVGKKSPGLPGKGASE